jgi:hypothetical protein
MKKLGKLTISPEKIMKNEDLINLQGGYESHYLRCVREEEEDCTWPVTNCDDYQILMQMCRNWCPGTIHAFCV